MMYLLFIYYMLFYLYLYLFHKTVTLHSKAPFVNIIIMHYPTMSNNMSTAFINLC